MAIDDKAPRSKRAGVEVCDPNSAETEHNNHGDVQFGGGLLPRPSCRSPRPAISAAELPGKAVGNAERSCIIKHKRTALFKPLERPQERKAAPAIKKTWPGISSRTNSTSV
jgi:hypothetical protein